MPLYRTMSDENYHFILRHTHLPIPELVELTGEAYNTIYQTFLRRGVKPVLKQKHERKVPTRKEQDEKPKRVYAPAVYTNSPSPYGIADELHKQLA